jgi:hypothetical protein
MATNKAKARRPKRGQRVLVNGRSEESAHHVRLYGRHMASPAWRSLSPVARCLYVELKLLYVGTNNGKLFLSVRVAAERINVAKTTAGLAFKELEKRGFIRLAKPSSFNMKATGRRCVKLYLPRGGHRFWSRAAYRLGYACQREDRMYQAQRQALKVYRALQGDGNWRDGAPPKPKWMRWRTYERLADKLDFHNARFDGGWLVGVSRLLGRRPASS